MHTKIIKLRDKFAAVAVFSEDHEMLVDRDCKNYWHRKKKGAREACAVDTKEEAVAIARSCESTWKGCMAR